MTDLVFWGGSGQARVLRDAIEGTAYRLAALFDNAEVRSPFEDVPIMIGERGFDSWAARQERLSEIRSCVAIGGNLGNDRLAIQAWLLKRGLLPITVIHRTAFVASTSTIGDGCQILALSAVCANVRLGQSVIVNTSASVDHCCVIGDGTHIGPGARLAGEVMVGENVFVGTGAVILPRINIGGGATIGAGAVVTRNVASGDVVVGSPARSKSSS